MTLLLVDDDPDLRAMLALALEDEGYRVLVAADAESALHEFARHTVDAALVDVRLPGMSGLELCREVRRRGRTPLVAVTAQTSLDDVLAGFEAGVDDYVVKPVVVTELVARVRSLLEQRRADGAAPATIRVGELVIHLPGGEVTGAGEPIALTVVEARLLAALAERPGAVLRREELSERVWGPDRFEDLRLVDAHVQRLRARLASGNAGRPVIVSVLGVGYRLAV